jgi:hypothetical protein
MILQGIRGVRNTEAPSRRIVEKVGESSEFEGQASDLGVSVGIVVRPEDGVEMTAPIDGGRLFDMRRESVVEGGA